MKDLGLWLVRGLGALQFCITCKFGFDNNSCFNFDWWILSVNLNFKALSLVLYESVPFILNIKESLHSLLTFGFIKKLFFWRCAQNSLTRRFPKLSFISPFLAIYIMKMSFQEKKLNLNFKKSQRRLKKAQNSWKMDNFKFFEISF